MEGSSGRRQSARHVDKKRPNYFAEKVHSDESPKMITGTKRPRPVRAKESPKNSNDDAVRSTDRQRVKDDVVRSTVRAKESPKISNGDVVRSTDRQRVKETLRMFNTTYLRFIQEEEERERLADPNPQIKTSKAKENKKRVSKRPDLKAMTKEEEERERLADPNPQIKTRKDKANKKRVSKRPDLKAMTEMMKNKTVLYHDKRIGSLPGIEVGDQFYSRTEMVVLGLHGHWLNGIDCMGEKYASKNLGYTFPLAVSIVMSGMYEDDVDNSEDVIYTGQGGHDLLGSNRQIKDQELTRGNLALKNNYLCGAPVRVVRGHKCKSSYCGKIYTYDGLYKVIKYWAEKGASKFTVYKYKLRRMKGQAALTTNEVRFSRGAVPQSISSLKGLLLEDISFGQENLKIPATNVVDDSPFPHTDFKYSKSIILGKNVKLPNDIHDGCGCNGACVDPKICSCARLNGNTFPYVRTDGGRLIEAKQVVIECGRGCSCNSTCVNRTSQQGLKYQLEVFRTANKGWAVRSWDTIPAGAPVCEYTGILSRSDDVEGASENDYLFDIDCLQTIKGIDGREIRSGGKEMQSLFEEQKTDTAVYCIDAGSVGNVARFINHSCQPNLFVQCVLTSHRDLRMCKIMLFAADNIPPLQELCYDYNYVLDSVVGSDGKVVKHACYCGSVGCRERLH